jgi:hypothetical protein
MTIEVRCPNGHLLQVDEKHRGKFGRCPRCHVRVRVPRRRVSEDDILSILGCPPNRSAAAADGFSPDSTEQYVHQAPRRNGHAHPHDPGPLDSSILRRQKFCPRCGRMTSYSFKWCPGCGARLTDRASLQAEAPRE